MGANAPPGTTYVPGPVSPKTTWRSQSQLYEAIVTISTAKVQSNCQLEIHAPAELPGTKRLNLLALVTVAYPAITSRILHSSFDPESALVRLSKEQNVGGIKHFRIPRSLEP